MGMALCGCLVLAVVVLGYRQLQRARQRAAATAAANEKNALDLGLELLIKDISRHTEPARPMMMSAAPRTRTAQGTPTDVASTRLRVAAIPPALANLFDEDDDDAPTAHAGRAYHEN